MKEDTTVLPFYQPETIVDPLTELAREGARRMLAEALKAEADAFVAGFADERLEDGRRRVVRHGSGPERQIQTGIGALAVQRPKVRPDGHTRFSGKDPLHIEYIAQMGAPFTQFGCVIAGALFEGRLNGRFPRSAVSHHRS